MTDMTMEEWQAKAKKMYFEDKLNIHEISLKIGITRRSISKYLNQQSGYKEEFQRRKAANKENRRDYKRNWDRKNRPGRYMNVTGDTLRREHDVAAIILSHEKY